MEMTDLHEASPVSQYVTGAISNNINPLDHSFAPHCTEGCACARAQAIPHLVALRTSFAGSKEASKRDSNLITSTRIREILLSSMTLDKKIL